ncbi:DUF2065 family protein [Rhizobium sp. L1K21]|uniref:DUF2065 domain-containing protein n=1 Tax=Rhizobium sp. L1K21 TaxID=2954933 RepID=UPI002093A0AA|nr:DUF2065 family protein [Rhizobium sp. L1K21]MCO6185705.1 DUF2065 family protein [Rhizobium sp. L1K21]
MSDFFTGIAFFLVIKGLVYALAPRLLKEMAAMIPSIPEDILRRFGVGAIAVGVFLIWLIRVYLA